MTVPDTAVLLIGGVDPSGGAGLFLDARAVHAVGAHPCGIVSVRTIQDGLRFSSAIAEDASDVEKTVRLMLGRFPVGAVKIGAIGNAANAEMLARLAEEDNFPPVIVDPVLGSTSGGRLLDDGAIDILRRMLLPRVTLVTPNLHEAGALTGQTVDDIDGMRAAGHSLLDMGAAAALVKGGHLDGPDALDLFVAPDGTERIFRTERVAVSDVRGTGCALASLIAAMVARGGEIPDAIARAKEFLTNAIVSSYPLGDGPRMLGSFCRKSADSR